MCVRVCARLYIGSLSICLSIYLFSRRIDLITRNGTRWANSNMFINIVPLKKKTQKRTHTQNKKNKKEKKTHKICKQIHTHKQDKIKSIKTKFLVLFRVYFLHLKTLFLTQKKIESKLIIIFWYCSPMEWRITITSKTAIFTLSYAYLNDGW